MFLALVTVISSFFLYKDTVKLGYTEVGAKKIDTNGERDIKLRSVTVDMVYYEEYKFYVFWSGSRILAQFGSGSRVMLSSLEKNVKQF